MSMLYMPARGSIAEPALSCAAGDSQSDSVEHRAGYQSPCSIFFFEICIREQGDRYGIFREDIERDSEFRRDVGHGGCGFRYYAVCKVVVGADQLPRNVALDESDRGVKAPKFRCHFDDFALTMRRFGLGRLGERA